MPAAKTAATSAKRVPAAAESRTLAKPGRIRLSKALATKPAGKPADLKAPAVLKKPNGATLKKFKLRSNRYKIPDNEFAQLTALKKRVLALGVIAKKSELLRAGLLLLVTLDDVQLKKAVAKVDFVKIGLPPKKTY